jgi:hypothetical protein
MPTFPAFFRSLLLALVCALATLPAWAQELPAPKITGADLRRALIWTGHYSVMNTGDPAILFRAAVQSWQASKKYKVTDNLADEQEVELLAEGDKQRDAFGWAKLEDKSIGFSIGVPTKLMKFLGAHTENGGLRALWRPELQQRRFPARAPVADGASHLQGRIRRRLRPRRRQQRPDRIPAGRVPHLGCGDRQHRHSEKPGR